MNIYEEFRENEKKIMYLLAIIDGFEPNGKVIDFSLEEAKYRRLFYDKVEKLGIKAFDLSQYTDEEKPFMKEMLDKLNKYLEIQNK